MTRDEMGEAVGNRYGATAHMARMFATEDLSPEDRKIAQPCAVLAIDMIRSLDDGPELTVGLRKLLEARDCFLRGRRP